MNKELLKSIDDLYKKIDYHFDSHMAGNPFDKTCDLIKEFIREEKSKGADWAKEANKNEWLKRCLIKRICSYRSDPNDIEKIEYFFSTPHHILAIYALYVNYRDFIDSIITSFQAKVLFENIRDAETKKMNERLNESLKNYK